MSAGRSGRRRGASQPEETRSSRLGSCCIKARARERGAQGAQGAGRAAYGWASGLGPAGGNSAGRAAQPPPAASPRARRLPSSAPILVARIGWAGQVSRLEASRERQSVPAAAGRPGSASPEGPGGSPGPGCGLCTSPRPPLASISSPGSLSAALTSNLGATSAL